MSIEESIQRMKVLNKEQELADLRKQIASLEEQLQTVRDLNDLIREDVRVAREAAQWYFDAFMGAIDEMESLAPRLGIPSNIAQSQRVTVWAYAQEKYPFINITPLRTRQRNTEPGITGDS